jgi:hypothetical protein
MLVETVPCPEWIPHTAFFALPIFRNSTVISVFVVSFWFCKHVTFSASNSVFNFHVRTAEHFASAAR